MRGKLKGRQTGEEEGKGIMRGTIQTVHLSDSLRGKESFRIYRDGYEAQSGRERQVDERCDKV